MNRWEALVVSRLCRVMGGPRWLSCGSLRLPWRKGSGYRTQWIVSEKYDRFFRGGIYLPRRAYFPLRVSRMLSPCQYILSAQ